jgi:predicted patatin/cPLA2 family phospholipase
MNVRPKSEQKNWKVGKILRRRDSLCTLIITRWKHTPQTQTQIDEASKTFLSFIINAFDGCSGFHKVT